MGKGLVCQIFPAIQLHQFHHLFGGDSIQFSAVGGSTVQADGGERAGLSGGDVPVHVGDDALGQVVGNYFVVNGQLL
ncbi:MAG: hypothetical protein R2874_16335 [Desulfobacterales bacterium]